MARATPPRPWKPGQSGNPRGRPKGTGFAGQAREALAGRLPEILEAVVNAALNGDMQAARIILERTVPSIKPTELPIEGMALPAADATLTQQATDILAAATRGEVAPAQAAQLIASIGQVGKLMEVDELKARIEALEKAHGDT